jgi:hypothetical protein
VLRHVFRQGKDLLLHSPSGIEVIPAANEDIQPVVYATIIAPHLQRPSLSEVAREKDEMAEHIKALEHVTDEFLSACRSVRATVRLAQSSVEDVYDIEDRESNWGKKVGVVEDLAEALVDVEAKLDKAIQAWVDAAF